MSVNFIDINTEIHISSVTNGRDNGPMKGQKIKELMTTFISPDDLVPLKEWSKNLSIISVDWIISVFNSIFHHQ